MGARVDRALQLVEQLKGAGVPATVNPGEAEQIRPCVLVTPPAVDFGAGFSSVASYSLKVLAGDAGSTLEAWTALDDLVDDVAAVLEIETADPITYQLLPGDLETPPLLVPAYALSYNTSA